MGSRRPLARGRLVWFQENDVTKNKFMVGQIVRFTSGTVGRPGAGGSYKIIRVLPLEGDEHQYRIKSASEPHERIARESQLDRGS
jgi:hypothetical protein